MFSLKEERKNGRDEGRTTYVGKIILCLVWGEGQILKPQDLFHLLMCFPAGWFQLSDCFIPHSINCLT